MKSLIYFSLVSAGFSILVAACGNSVNTANSGSPQSDVNPTRDCLVTIYTPAGAWRNSYQIFYPAGHPKAFVDTIAGKEFHLTVEHNSIRIDSDKNRLAVNFPDPASWQSDSRLVVEGGALGEVPPYDLKGCLALAARAATYAARQIAESVCHSNDSDASNERRRFLWSFGTIRLSSAAPSESDVPVKVRVEKSCFATPF